jgi:hypothetical protein
MFTITSESSGFAAQKNSMLQRTMSCEPLSDVAVLEFAMTLAGYKSSFLCNTVCFAFSLIPTTASYEMTSNPGNPQPQPSFVLVRCSRTIRSGSGPRSWPHCSSRRGRITGELRRRWWRYAHSCNHIVHLKVVHLPIRFQECLRVVGNEDVARSPRLVGSLLHTSAYGLRRSRQRDLPSDTHASGKCSQQCCRKSPC